MYTNKNIVSKSFFCHMTGATFSVLSTSNNVVFAIDLDGNECKFYDVVFINRANKGSLTEVKSTEKCNSFDVKAALSGGISF